MVGHPAGADTQDQGEVADQAVVGTEYRSSEAARKAVAAPGGQGANDFLVDALIRRHHGGGVDVRVIRRAGLSPLREGEDKHRAEVPRQKAQDAGAQITLPRLADLLAEQCEPVLFVAALGGGQGQQDVSLFPGASPRQIAVHGRLGPFIGQMLTPAAQIRRTRVAILGYDSPSSGVIRRNILLPSIKEIIPD